MALTSLDVGDIFLTVISTQSFETCLRSITFREFWEVSLSFSFPLCLILIAGSHSVRIGRISEDQGPSLPRPLSDDSR